MSYSISGPGVEPAVARLHHNYCIIRHFPFVFTNVVPAGFETLLDALLHDSSPIILNFCSNFTIPVHHVA